jgi:hypothetical protein
MSLKAFNILLVATSLLGFLEWGGGNQSFLFQVEAELFSKLFVDPRSVVHPFTILPVLGQLFLLITLFQKHPDKGLTYTGIACLSLLLVFMFIIGLMSFNIKVILSTLPFLMVAIFTIWHRRRSTVRT